MTAFPPPPIVNAIADSTGMVTTPWNLYFQALTQLADTNNAATVTVEDTESATTYLGLFQSPTGNLGPKTNTNLTYNAVTQTLSAPNVLGASFKTLKEVTTSTITNNTDPAVNQIKYRMGAADNIAFTQLSTTDHPFSDTLTIRRNANYIGGSNTWDNCGLRVRTDVSAGAQTDEWVILGELYNSSTNNNNVAVTGVAFIQTASVGTTWGMLAACTDQSGSDRSAGPTIGIEIGVAANGPNTSRNRIAANIVAGKYGSGADSECWAGIYMNSASATTDGYYNNGIHIGNDPLNPGTILTCDNGVKLVTTGTYGFWDSGNKTTGLLLQSVYSGAALAVDNTTGQHLPSAIHAGSAQIAAADGVVASMQMDSFAINGALQFRRADGTAASPSALQSDEAIGFVSARGYGTAGYSTARAQIKLATAEIWTDAHQGAYISVFTTPTGSATIAEAGRIDAGANWLAGYNGTTGVIATNASDRMLGFTTCAGAPSGTPTTYTGMARGLLDSTNNNWVVWNPVSAAWVTFSSAVTTTFLDSVFRVKDNGDSTKQLAFECSGISTATTRTLTVPNFDGTIATLAGVEAFSNKTTISQTGVHTIKASSGSAALPTAETGTLLQIGNANSTDVVIELDSFNSGCQLLGKRAQGTIASKTAVTANAALLLLGGLGYDGSAYSGIQGNIQIAAAALWSGTDHSTYIKFNVTPIGSTTIAEVARFNSSGLDLGANSIAMTGSLGATGARLTKGWFADLQVTNAIVADITGNAATVTIADAGGDTTTFPLLGTSATGNLAPATDAGLSYNATTNALTTTTFIGALQGNADTATTSTTATTATNVTVANEVTDTTCFPLFVTAATGGLPPKSNASLTYNSNTGALGSTSFVGALTGNADTATQIKSVNEASDTTCFPLFISASGTQTLQPLNNTSFTFNASTGALGATSAALTALSTIKATTGGAALPTAETGVLFQIGNADSTTTAIELDGFAGGCQILGKRSQGTIASKSADTANAALLQLGGLGFDSSAYSAIQGNIQIAAAETFAVGAHGTYIKFTTTPIGSTTQAEAMRISDVANVKIGGTANRGTTEGTNTLSLFNGTAPAGTLTNGASFFAAAGEMKVIDSAGNVTLLSPHDKATNEWIYDSIDTRTGRHLKIDMERMMKAINDKFGWDFVHEYAAAA